MAKADKEVFVCSECGDDHSKWQGQCASCGEWNTLKSMKVGTGKVASIGGARSGYAGAVSKPQNINDIKASNVRRAETGSSEFDRVLGGGLVYGSTILLGGHPGAGKSTELLQIMCHLSMTQTCLYFSGEESLEQISARRSRLGREAKNLILQAETNIDNIYRTIDEYKAQFVVIDSIQCMHLSRIDSAPGSVTQVRECTAAINQYAKQSGVTFILIGHVTKDASKIAGPMAVQHIVDAELLMESPADSRFRTLRSNKNRFGATQEIGFFGMTEKGLVDIPNPSSIFLQRSEVPVPGSVVTVLWEGTRSLLIETQSLLDKAQPGQARRLSVGYDHGRLSMALAVLSRVGGISTSDQDCFVNVVGGLKITETGADLAVLGAIISSLTDKVINPNTVIFGEISLSGHIRPVANGQERLKEAAKHGFEVAYVPKSNMPSQTFEGLKVIGVDSITEFIDKLGVHSK